MNDDIEIEFGTRGVESASRDVRGFANDVEGVGSSGRSMGRNMKAGAVMAVAAVTSVVAVAVDLAGVGLDLELMGQRVTTIFGDSADEINVWAEEVDTAMGTSSQRVAGLAANVGDLLIPLGATREEASELSQKAIELASDIDLWSTATGSVEEATERLTKAMLGETDGLLSLGINIKAATIDAHLLETGQAGLEGQALALARAQAVLTLATEQSGDAIAFAGSDAAETQLKVRAMQERWVSLKDDLSEKVLPVMIAIGDKLLDFADWMETKAIPAGKRFYDEWIVPVNEGIQWVIDKVTTLIDTIDKVQFPALPGYLGGNENGGFGESLKGAIQITTGIPMFAQGGEIQPELGGKVARVAEAGEAETIIPSARLAGLYGADAGAAPIIHIHTGILSHPAEVGAAVVDALEAYSRNNGRAWARAS